MNVMTKSIFLGRIEDISLVLCSKFVRYICVGMVDIAVSKILIVWQFVGEV